MVLGSTHPTDSIDIWFFISIKKWRSSAQYLLSDVLCCSLAEAYIWPLWEHAEPNIPSEAREAVTLRWNRLTFPAILWQHAVRHWNMEVENQNIKRKCDFFHSATEQSVSVSINWYSWQTIKTVQFVLIIIFFQFLTSSNPAAGRSLPSWRMPPEIRGDYTKTEDRVKLKSWLDEVFTSPLVNVSSKWSICKKKD